jgi:hypothetical protein
MPLPYLRIWRARRWVLSPQTPFIL